MKLKKSRKKYFLETPYNMYSKYNLLDFFKYVYYYYIQKKLLRETGIQSLQIHFFSNVIEYWIGVKERENRRKKLFLPSKDLKDIKSFYICRSKLYANTLRKILLFYFFFNIQSESRIRINQWWFKHYWLRMSKVMELRQPFYVFLSNISLNLKKNGGIEKEGN